MTIRRTVLDVARTRKAFTTSDVLAALGRRVSRQYMSAAISQLVKEGVLVKGGSTRGAFYALPKHAVAMRLTIRTRLKNHSLQEDQVLDDLKRGAPFLTGLRENVGNIFAYAFLEMLNNAIEHSRSKNIDVEVTKRQGQLTFIVRDFGIGAFRNVMRTRGLASELEAIQDLLKGKTTTQSQRHSGEGIFFTSKAGDLFLLESFRHRLRVDNVVGDYFIEDLKPARRGTRVVFTIAGDSRRDLSDTFRKYQVDASEPGFDKSEVKVHLYARGTAYLSRSQARRVLAGLEKFRSVVLDFDRVQTIGQGFADEVFRVFRQQHPETAISAINMSETVRFMIERVGKP